jgi:HD-like signal output (HDOD) protein
VSNDRPSEFEGRIAPDEDWRAIVALVGDIPPMPNVAQQAIGKIEDPNINAIELAKLLESDAALAARILKISNSTMFCRSREIKTLNQAIMVIGFKALKGIIVAAALQQMKQRPGPNDRLVWEHALGTAMASLNLAKKLTKSYADEAFLIGLLHSLGQVVFLSNKELAKDFKSVLQLIKEKEVEYVEAEQEHFGFSHTLIGALVGKKWNFPPETCQVILHYADSYEDLDAAKPDGEKGLIVQMAEALSHAAGLGSPDGYPCQKSKIKYIASELDIASENLDEDIEQMIEELKAQYEEESAVYG